ncbi:MAG: hypothetical protein FRX48_04261 [Lasallia pustulata]|uniref:Uncharacterized protein n=1 Tax=Lasallia pustulata TaxID=136370 RepID=A0A5M8PRG5_9LECA|nr:MAG: hypothetical protein FRX48_04261 [Lasallia pustulata]
MTEAANPSGHLQFGMPTAEDPMELVSDMDRRPAIDEDNDIDLDLTGDQPEDDDDYMIDDAHSDADQQLYPEDPLQAGNDDEMVDEEDAPAPQEDEDTMPINDEELDDATFSIQEYSAKSVGEYYYSETLQDDPSAFGQDALREEPAETIVAYDKDIISMQEEHTRQNIPQTEALTQTSTPELESASDAVVHAETGTIGEVEDSADKVLIKGNAHDSSGITTFQDVTGLRKEDSQADEDPGIHASVDSTSAPRNDDIPRLDDPLPVAQRLHPVVVIYLNNEISLFPPLEQNQESSQTFFVHDEKLAGQSISKLLEACRVVLDESIAEEEELEIRIEELGLYINEGAVESHTTTLTQILDTYLQLQHQDGFEDPDPLYLTLCTRIKFSHRLASLAAAAAEGKGLSQLRLWESPVDSDKLSDVQQGDSVSGSREVFNVDFTSAEVAASSPAEQPKKTDESRLAISLEEGVSSSARHQVVAESEPLRASEAVGSPGNQDARALGTSTSEPDALNDNATDQTDQGQQQNIPNPISKEDRQTIQGPDSPLLPAETGVENGDTIDYEDEDNTEQEASVGSSTLQGDVSETAVDEARPHYPRSVYAEGPNHDSAAEEVSEGKSENPYSLDVHLSTVGDVYQPDHSDPYGAEEDVLGEETFEAQDGLPAELRELEHEEHEKDQSEHQPVYQEAEEEEEEEQLDLDQSLQYANRGLLHTTKEDEVTDHRHTIPSTSNVDQAYERGQPDQPSTAHDDEVAGQGSLYHKQHSHEEASEADTAGHATAEEDGENKLVHTQVAGADNPATPTVRSEDETHNLPASATDVDEITYEEDEIEVVNDNDVIRADVNSSPKSLISSATLKRMRSSPEEDNAYETDFLVDPKRVRSG